MFGVLGWIFFSLISAFSSYNLLVDASPWKAIKKVLVAPSPVVVTESETQQSNHSDEEDDRVQKPSKSSSSSDSSESSGFSSGSSSAHPPLADQDGKCHGDGDSDGELPLADQSDDEDEEKEVNGVVTQEAAKALKETFEKRRFAFLHSDRHTEQEESLLEFCNLFAKALEGAETPLTKERLKIGVLDKGEIDILLGLADVAGCSGINKEQVVKCVKGLVKAHEEKLDKENLLDFFLARTYVFPEGEANKPCEALAQRVLTRLGLSAQTKENVGKIAGLCVVRNQKVQGLFKTDSTNFKGMGDFLLTSQNMKDFWPEILKRYRERQQKEGAVHDDEEE